MCSFSELCISLKQSFVNNYLLLAKQTNLGMVTNFTILDEIYQHLAFFDAFFFVFKKCVLLAHACISALFNNSLHRGGPTEHILFQLWYFRGITPCTHIHRKTSLYDPTTQSGLHRQPWRPLFGCRGDAGPHHYLSNRQGGGDGARAVRARLRV